MSNTKVYKNKTNWRIARKDYGWEWFLESKRRRFNTESDNRISIRVDEKDLEAMDFELVDEVSEIEKIEWALDVPVWRDTINQLAGVVNYLLQKEKERE